MIPVLDPHVEHALRSHLSHSLEGIQWELHNVTIHRSKHPFGEPVLEVAITIPTGERFRHEITITRGSPEKSDWSELADALYHKVLGVTDEPS